MHHSFWRRLSRNNAPNEECSLHSICAVCATVCRKSVIFNDPALIAHFSGKKTNIAADDADLPLRLSITDPSQYNELLSYLFEREIPHHATAAHLEKSAAGGCHMCSLLWNHLSLKRYDILTTEVDMEEKKLAEESRAEAREQIKRTSEQLFVRAFVDDPERKSWNPRYAGIALYAGSHKKELPELRSVLCVGPTKVVESVTGLKLTNASVTNLTKSTKSDRSLSQAKKWLTSCQNGTHHGQDHTMCSESFKAASWPTPTRLLDTHDSKVVRLRVNPTVGEVGTLQYACLSHCWGGSGSMKLTQDNYEKILIEGIKVSDMPATFRDAVDITQRLGLRYLWIDSLCIIQGSTSDWRQEASRMSDIYSYAVVTVAALAASNSNEGCYFNYDPLSYWPLILPTKSHGNSLAMWESRVWPFHNERLSNAPLLRRGWVMQERCLGNRMLFFGKFGIYWECASMRADEVFPSGFEEDGLGDTGKGLSSLHGETMMKAMVNRRLYLAGQDFMGAPLHMKVDELAAGHTLNPLIMWKFLGYWYNVVGAYSRTKLTFSRDKLVAMNGLVRLIRQRTSLTSLAGLWREFVLDDMLWSSVDPSLATRPANYRAPSFSWASIDGPIKREFTRLYCRIAGTMFLTEHSGIPHRPQATYLADVVSDTVELVDPTSDTGDVQRAELVLRGYLTRYVSRKTVKAGGERVWSHPWRDDLTGVWERWMELDVEADGASGEISAVLLPIMAWFEEDTRKRETQKLEDDNKTENKRDATGPGATTDVKASDPEQIYTVFHVAGLVLQSCGGAGSTYKRIGMFEHCERKEGRDVWVNGKMQETLTLV